MKKTLLFLGMFSSAVTFAQDCTKIFISEYVEGWSNNKALEIYNPTNQTIDLSQYFVARYSNGSASATVANAVQLTGTIAPYSVQVAVLDKRDQQGTGQEAPIWDSLEARGDQFYSPVYNTSSAFYWNGNDAVMLAKGTITGLALTTTINATNVAGLQVIDVFGKIGENPANETGSNAANDGAWSTQFPYNSGQGVLVTLDHSMIRKASIRKGVTANPSFFDPLLEYDTIPAVTYVVDQNGDTISGANGPILFGNWFSLGTHDCACNPLTVNENEVPEITVFPNPSADGVVYVKNTEEVKEIIIVNALGQVVTKIANNAAQIMTLRFGNDKGVYILKMVTSAGVVSTKRVVIK